MSDVDYTSLELTDDEIDTYLDFAFSKGTANVSPGDKKKLKPLLRHYAKMKHPFTACVRDNRKRFGSHTEEYCAVLKDLIVGSTKWRGKGKKYVPKNLSEEQIEELKSEVGIEIPEGFSEFMSSLTEKDIENMTEHNTSIIAENAHLADGEIVWNPNMGYDSLRRKIQSSLNEDYSSEDVNASYSYWVEDITKDMALVCHGGTEYYVVPFSLRRGEVEVAQEEEWKMVEKAWVEANLSQDSQILAEMYFEDSDTTEEDGLIWKTILREGTWKFSPGSDQKPIAKPITIVKNGKSDAKKLIISMDEIKENFDNGVVEHVTIPVTHADTVLENTGFVKALRFGKDDKGRATLEAGHEFTEPDVKEKVERGTIANTSAGVLFDYIQKEVGKKFNAVIAHVALTNHPWLNGMKPFGVEASENMAIVTFSEDISDSAQEAEGGEIVSTTEVETTTTEETTTEAPSPTFLDEIGLSEDEVRERLHRLDAAEAENKRSRIDARCKSWQDEGKSPALVKEAKAILMADNGTVAINLSEEGETKNLSLSEVVERLVNSVPNNDLTEDHGSEEESSGGAKPDDDATLENANLSHDEKVELFGLMFTDNMLTEKEALTQILKKRQGE
jgi:phage I-like protein